MPCPRYCMAELLSAAVKGSLILAEIGMWIYTRDLTREVCPYWSFWASLWRSALLTMVSFWVHWPGEYCFAVDLFFTDYLIPESNWEIPERFLLDTLPV